MAQNTEAALTMWLMIGCAEIALREKAEGRENTQKGNMHKSIKLEFEDASCNALHSLEASTSHLTFTTATGSQLTANRSPCLLATTYLLIAPNL